VQFLIDNLPRSPGTWAFLVYVAAVGFIVLAMLLGSWVLGGRNRGRAKNEPFESGVVSIGGGHLRFSAKYYLVAMFFVIFDLEAVYLYAWGVTVRQDGWSGFIEAAVFIVVLLIGLVYLWRLGALDWAPKPRLRRLREAQLAQQRAAQQEQPQATPPA
jgi:NADH-quinone oxidoreductase subunit A